MYLKAESGGIPWRPAKIVDGYRIKPLVLSDSAYPSTTWQVKPYNFNINLTESQKAFNKNLSSAWVTVVRAFGVLKDHWHCLLKRLDNRLINVSDIIITCCTLHNICQERSDEFIDKKTISSIISWTTDVDNGIVNMVIFKNKERQKF